MSDWSGLITIFSVVAALMGGLFGQKLVDGYFRRAKDAADATGTLATRQFADNEQARNWLRGQLEERDTELKGLRERERYLLDRVGALAEQVARQEERTASQATQITALQATVAKWNADYAEVKAERDKYRDAKHDAENRATAELLRSQLAARDLKDRDAEIERLKGQIIAQTDRAQTDRLEERSRDTHQLARDTNERLRAGEIGDAGRRLASQDQANEIQATGDASLERLRREGIGDDHDAQR